MTPVLWLLLGGASAIGLARLLSPGWAILVAGALLTATLMLETWRAAESEAQSWADRQTALRRWESWR